MSRTRVVCAMAFGSAVVALARAQAPVRVYHEISAVHGGLGGTLADHSHFGAAVASLGDLDGDGVGDLAVGSPEDDDHRPGTGKVWILRLRADATVQATQAIAEGEGEFGGTLWAAMRRRHGGRGNGMARRRAPRERRHAAIGRRDRRAGPTLARRCARRAEPGELLHLALERSSPQSSRDDRSRIADRLHGRSYATRSPPRAAAFRVHRWTGCPSGNLRVDRTPRVPDIGAVGYGSLAELPATGTGVHAARGDRGSPCCDPARLERDQRRDRRNSLTPSGRADGPGPTRTASRLLRESVASALDALVQVRRVIERSRGHQVHVEVVDLHSAERLADDEVTVRRSHRAEPRRDTAGLARRFVGRRSVRSGGVEYRPLVVSRADSAAELGTSSMSKSIAADTTLT
ncbi:MAG: FG-GAP repeat protein [Planctomycetes bacterium]|nr:FG-GAP repeat protein [Planctomycetota bacterium]MBI3847978.1 FG-GAP repeat protein [Planctomycetota bacterium]